MKTSLFRPVVLFVSCFLLAGIGRGTESYAGTYRSETGFELTLVEEADDRYSGVAVFGDAEGSVQLQAKADGLAGTLIFGGSTSAVEFHAGGEGRYIFTDGQFAIDLRRPQAPAAASPLEAFGRPHAGRDTAPASSEKSGAGEATAKANDGPPQGWTRFTHPTGSSFDHPSDWSIEDTGNLLQIIPPDLQAGQEMIYATGMPVQGITSAADPQVGPYLDTVLQQVNPTARRQGPPAPRETKSGPGALYTYTGSHPLTGAAVGARVYVMIQDGLAVTFTLLGENRALARRTAVVDRIFASFAMGTPTGGLTSVGTAPETGTAANLDPQLFGYWYGEAVARPTEGTMVNSRFTYFLGSDGTAMMGAQSAINVAIQNPSGVYNRGGASGGSSNVTKGRWSAQNGILRVQWQDGTGATTRYRVNGRTLEIRDFQGKLITFYER